jgi:hypothetical protein
MVIAARWKLKRIYFATIAGFGRVTMNCAYMPTKEKLFIF